MVADLLSTAFFLLRSALLSTFYLERIYLQYYLIATIWFVVGLATFLFLNDAHSDPWYVGGNEF